MVGVRLGGTGQHVATILADPNQGLETLTFNRKVNLPVRNTPGY